MPRGLYTTPDGGFTQAQLVVAQGERKTDVEVPLKRERPKKSRHAPLLRMDGTEVAMLATRGNLAWDRAVMHQTVDDTERMTFSSSFTF